MIFQLQSANAQFLRLWIGAGMRPPRAINALLSQPFTRMTGAVPSRPPNSTESPTPLPAPG